MKKLDLMTILGILLGLGLVGGGIAAQSEITAFWDTSGLMITVGGSFGALLVNFQFSQIRTVFQLTREAFFEKQQSVVQMDSLFVRLAQKARREGLLSLEDELEKLDDDFLRKGLQMVIDGFEPEFIRDILETEINSLEQRHQLGQSLFRTWGLLSPAFGMIGTLIGLVQMLTCLDDPSGIGPGMAVALLTTFYGVLMANLLFNPIAGKLAIRSEAEVARKEAIIEALLALQEGMNPRLLQEKMKAFLSPEERKLLEKEETPIGEEGAEEAMADHA